MGVGRGGPIPLDFEEWR